MPAHSLKVHSLFGYIGKGYVLRCGDAQAATQQLSAEQLPASPALSAADAAAAAPAVRRDSLNATNGSIDKHTDAPPMPPLVRSPAAAVGVGASPSTGQKPPSALTSRIVSNDDTGGGSGTDNGGEDGALRVPKFLSDGWLAASNRVKRQPTVDYANCVLYNWTMIDPKGHITPDNVSRRRPTSMVRLVMRCARPARIT
eukprot:scaffold153350_cov30-Tisochrysis_lutea.AAC.6